MEQDEREDCSSIITRHNLNEDDFEIIESTTYPKVGVGPLSGTITVKYKPSGTEKAYQHFGHAWLEEFEHDLKTNFYNAKV